MKYKIKKRSKNPRRLQLQDNRMYLNYTFHQYLRTGARTFCYKVLPLQRQQKQEIFDP